MVNVNRAESVKVDVVELLGSLCKLADSKDVNPGVRSLCKQARTDRSCIEEQVFHTLGFVVLLNHKLFCS